MERRRRIAAIQLASLVTSASEAITGDKASSEFASLSLSLSRRIAVLTHNLAPQNCRSAHPLHALTAQSALTPLLDATHLRFS